MFRPRLGRGLGRGTRGRGLRGRLPLRRAGRELYEVVLPTNTVPLRDPALRERRRAEGGAFLAWTVERRI
jgi:hypothetical protein